MDEYKNFLDGKWMDALSGGTFEDVNPANRSDVLGVFPRSDHRDIDRAVETARAYAPVWSEVPAARRSAVLSRAAMMLWEQRDDVIRLVTRDTGKLLAESRAELDDGVAALRALAEEGGRLAGTLASAAASKGLRFTVPVSRGVAGVITDWTFPLAGALWRVCAALVAGNTVVWKAAPEAPLVSTRVLDVLLNAGVDSKAVNLVHGQNEEAGAPLVRHPDLDIISFAGSAEEAREVAIAGAAEQRPACVDIGERLAAVVLDDADLDRAIPALVRAVTCFAGQRWRGPAWIVSHRKIVKEVAEQLAAQLERLRLGDGADADSDVGPLIGDAAIKRLHGCTRLATKEGARLLVGGEAYREGECKRGWFYLPTLFTDVTAKMRVAQQENVAGLTVLLTSVAGTDDALATANRVRDPRTVLVFTRDTERIQRSVEGIRTGRVVVNAPGDTTGERSWAHYARPADLPPTLATWVEWKAVDIFPSAPRRTAGDPR